MATAEVKTKRLTLSISNIAPLIGLDNYNNFPRIFCEIWRRFNPTEFREFELRMKEDGNKLANSSELNDIWEIDELIGTNLLQQVKELNSNKDKSSNEMVKVQSDITKYINKQETLDIKQKEELVKKVCSITNKNHGVNNEDAILKEFCRLSEKTLTNEQGWVEIPLVKLSNNIEWIIIGKYDGITTENELVEAKMRQKCLFKKMRDYENVQVQLYLHALGYKQGYLVESFTNKKNDMQLYTHEVQYNEEYVNEVILERLKQFIKFFELVMSDDKMKQDIIKGDLKREIYKQYETDYLGIEHIQF